MKEKIRERTLNKGKTVILRLFSLLELTRVYSFEKTFVYPGGSSRIKSMFSKIMFSGSRYVIHSNKGKNEDSDE